MVLQSKIEDDLKNALRERQDLKKTTLRLVLTEIKVESVARGQPLNDEEVVQVLRKQVQIRREMIDEATKAGRSDLVDEAEAEIEILNEYLPPPFPREELERLAAESIAETGADNIGDTGKVMKDLMPKLKGQVPGGEAHKVVQGLLSANG